MKSRILRSVPEILTVTQILVNNHSWCRKMADNSNSSNNNSNNNNNNNNNDNNNVVFNSITVKLTKFLNLLKMKNKVKVKKLATVVKGDPKDCFSIATLFPGLFYFTLDLYLIMPSVKQGGIKYHF